MDWVLKGVEISVRDFYAAGFWFLGIPGFFGAMVHTAVYIS